MILIDKDQNLNQNMDDQELSQERDATVLSSDEKLIEALNQINYFYEELLLGDEERINFTLSGLLRLKDDNLIEKVKVDINKPFTQSSKLAQTLTFRVFQKE